MPFLRRRSRNKYVAAAGRPSSTGGFVQLRDLVKTYYNTAGEFPVLKGIDADFNRGEFIAVIGKSGSGKSTLINMITGIDRPTSGEIYIGDVAVHTLSENQLAIWRGRNVGVVFQFFQLLPMLSLVDNIMLPMDFCGVFTARERKRRAMQLLEMIDMTDHANKLPSAISGGQQQRVAIARALANDPPVLVADEPTGNLDSVTAESVYGIFEDMIRRGRTVIMVTHDSSLARRVTRTLLLADGEIVNEFVARALPQLSHVQMLKATRQLRPLRFAPGEAIIQEGTMSDTFYIVQQGHVEVALKRPGGEEIIVATMRAGEYFGEIELLRGGKTLATVRAPIDTPVEVLALNRDPFCELMDESASTRAAISRVVEDRIAENVAVGSGSTI